MALEAPKPKVNKKPRRLYDDLGSHITKKGDVEGVQFAVWAPNAREVSVIGDFNKWNAGANLLEKRPDASGIWEAFVPGAAKGAMYKYCITSQFNNYRVEKRDPVAFYCEIPPARASIVWDLEYKWDDAKWMRARHRKNSLAAPMSIYEVHLGSWRRDPKDPNKFLTYSEITGPLIEYVKGMGFTHVEFMPLTAHPLYDSWGYQTDGYFAPTSRYGAPQDLMQMIDKLHQSGIGVILDWVPSHFPCDKHGLAFFDGTHLYEHADARKGFHPEWRSSIFNYGRNEVSDFLIQSALFWLDKYHVDGLRVDGGSSMLYLDYGRKHGGWIPNKFGGRENLEAVDFLKKLNDTILKDYPHVQIILEEATTWPKVSRPTKDGGLGFGMKWNMGWMNDTLSYFTKHYHDRRHFHNKLTFSMLYAFNENFLLALSHDEVVHTKRSLVNKMPGNDWQKFANLRLLFGYMYGHPGKKLFFMGGEFGQWAEWNYRKSLDWHLLEHSTHKGAQKWVTDLNHLYKKEPGLYGIDFSWEGFEWIDCNDSRQSVISFVRKTKRPEDSVICVYNFSPTAYCNYQIGCPADGLWKELLNSNGKEYGGDGLGNYGGVTAQPCSYHGRPFSLFLTLPPLTALFFKRQAPVKEPQKELQKEPQIEAQSQPPKEPQNGPQ